VAIDVLAYVQNKNAAPALFSYATGQADTPLRVRAMIACGALGAAELLPRYERYLFPRGTAEGEGDDPPTDAAAVAASWGVARMADKRALPLLRELSKRGSAEMRALAVLGLGLLHDRGSVAEIARIAKSPDSGNVTRAAAAYALGEVGAEPETATLTVIAEGSDVLPREMALVALARLGSGRAPIAAMADATFAGSDSDGARSRANAEAVQRAGSRALMLLATSRGGPPRGVKSPLVVPDGALNVEAELEHLVPDGFSSEDRAATLTTFGDALQRAAISAMETSSNGVRAVLDALGDGNGTLLPFVGPDDTSEAAHAKAREIARALEPSLVNLTRDTDPSLRARAVLLLGRSKSDAAISAVVLATRDENEAVQRAALASIGARSSPAALEAVSSALAHREGDRFAIRVLAAQALARLGSGGAGEDAARPLREAATRDTYALVREAALTSLAGFDPAGARALAAQMVAIDPEPRLRDAARAIVSGSPPRDASHDSGAQP
jgi:HEAT repeat protein